MSSHEKAFLLFHWSLSAGKTEVDVKDGIVTLRGHAASQAQKELTTEYARDVEGVKDVKNEMTVWAMGLSNPEGGANVVDDRCGAADSVAAGVGEQLHDGWVHPYFACDRNCCSVDKSHSGEKNYIIVHDRNHH